MKIYKVVISMVVLSMFFSCGSSNQKYKDDVERSFKSILYVGVSKEEITTFLTNSGRQYSEQYEKKCHNEKIDIVTDDCSDRLVIHTRVNIEKTLNPVKSGAHVYFKFDKSNLLESHKIDIRHGFL